MTFSKSMLALKSVSGKFYLRIDTFLEILILLGEAVSSISDDSQSELIITMPTVKQPIRAQSLNSRKTAGYWDTLCRRPFSV